MDVFKFPEGFELGVASAATQIEGGNVNTNWHDWAKAGKIRDNSSPSVANMHWEKWEEDDALMAELGIRHARIGIEWVRIEPELGVFDETGLQHYIDELTYMRSKGIEPLVTLHHFSNPSWFEKLGGFTDYENVKYFIEFAEYVVKGFGDLCNQYITINEPNVYAHGAYLGEGFPPGKMSLPLYFEVISNFTSAHIQCYKLIHKLNPSASVGTAMHLSVFQPKNIYIPTNIFLSKFYEYYFQTALCNAMAYGKIVPPLKRKPHVEQGEYCDFWGLNYYSRQTISTLKIGIPDDCKINDLGWEIYPEGISTCAQKLYDIMPRDIYITENGTCDNNDVWRSRYIYDHLRVLLNSGLPVKRYYHWCFVDNWEWLEGESARFGIVHIDYRTQKRTVKDSGYFFSEMIKNQGCTQEMYDKYVRGRKYKEQ
ncbi:MAG TPA: glycoside hydrolase family 1 protein [Mogibacterium sp.]|nr:glycoside hydrolase family 1 protein [Mogibacterium sp.]